MRNALGAEGRRESALELLLQLVRVDRDGSRHARRRLTYEDAVAVAGGSAEGQDVVNRLAGARDRGQPHTEGPVRLIAIEDRDDAAASA